MTAAAFGEDGHPRVQLDAGLEAPLRAAVSSHAHVLGRDALDGAVVVVEHLRGGEAGEYRDVERLRLLSQPAAQVSEADDVVAGLLCICGGVGSRIAPPRGQEEEPVFSRGGVQGGRGVPVHPVRNQLVERARLQHRAGENVGAHLGALLDDADREIRSVLGAELSQLDRGGKARRSRPDDDHVELHRLAFHVPFLPDTECTDSAGIFVAPQHAGKVLRTARSQP